MSSQGEFPIKITGDASSLVAASQKTNDALESTKIKLGELSPETKDYIKKLEESNDAAKKLEISHRNMRLGLHLLGPEFAEAGHLGIAAFANPLTAGLLGIGILTGKVISDWKKMRDAIDTAPDLSGIKNVTEALGDEGMLKALKEGIAAAEEFWQKLNRIANAPIPIKGKTDDTIEGEHKEHEATNRALAAKEKAELEELKVAKTKGTISAGEYEITKGQIEDRYAGQRTNLQAIEAGHTIEERKHEREVNQRIITEAPDTVGQKQRAAEEAKGRLEGQKAELEEWKKKLKEIDDWMREKGTAALSSSEGRQTYAVEEKERMLALHQIAHREQGTIPEAESAAKTTAEDLAEAQRRVLEAQGRNRDLDREIPKLEGDRSRNRASQADEAVSNRRFRIAGAENALAESKNQVHEDRAAIAHAMEHGEVLGAAVLQKMEQHVKVMQDLERRVQQLEGRPPKI